MRLMARELPYDQHNATFGENTERNRSPVPMRARSPEIWLQ